MDPLKIFLLVLTVVVLGIVSVSMFQYLSKNKCCDNYKNWKTCFPKSDLKGYYKVCRKDDGSCCPEEGFTADDCRDNYGDAVDTRYECNVIDKCRWHDSSICPNT